ncbi:uncharacterized protein SCHCODRAFT_02620058, partial [Schizophyllum commune H4-8]|uniref:uncharacterized protein n=1 Tax=Schizophyllum commune (strain H4-8 / FGSC 9210) TaxID=578458 RepID=UPI00215E0453
MAAVELPCKQVQIFFRVLLEKSSASSGARSAHLSSRIDFREEIRTSRYRAASGL